MTSNLEVITHKPYIQRTTLSLGHNIAPVYKKPAHKGTLEYVIVNTIHMFV